MFGRSIHDHSDVEEYYCDLKSSENRIKLMEIFNKTGKWPTFEELNVPKNCIMKLEYIVINENKI